MKGIVFNLLEQVVVEEHGDDAWDDLLTAADAAGVYSSVGQYDDAELLRLVDAAAVRLHTEREAVLEWFGRHAIGKLATAYPVFFSSAPTLRTFLLSLNDVIHREVRKLYPGAGVPTFGFADGPDGELLLTYDSPRALCHLAVGFARGAADHYQSAARVSTRSCLLEGDDACVIAVTGELT